MSESPLLEVRGVSKTFEGGGVRENPFSVFSKSEERDAVAADLRVQALSGLSTRFDSGEFTAIAGPSGSGKTTLFNLIGTLDAASEGDILFRGESLRGKSADELAEFRLRSLGFVFQAYNLVPVLSAAENVEYVLTLQGLDPEERRKRALEALASVGLEKHSERRPDLLSGGQQQRVAIARAIVHEPELVLADEPTANLDSKTSVEILDLMASLNRERGVTFLFSSHDPIVLERARRILWIRDGKLEREERK